MMMMMTMIKMVTTVVMDGADGDAMVVMSTTELPVLCTFSLFTPLNDHTRQPIALLMFSR